jgi:hypothetical protein
MNKNKMFEETKRKISGVVLKANYPMSGKKLDLLTNATVIDDAIRFVSHKSKENEKLKLSGDKEESKETDYDEDKGQLEEEQEEEAEETGEVTINQIF